MQKFILAAILAVAVFVTIVADIWKRSRDGIPDAAQTDITSLVFSSAPLIGAASVEITSSVRHQPKWNIEETRIDSLLSPFADFSLPEEKNKPNFRRKIINRIFLKTLVFSDKKQKAALISVEIPQITGQQLEAIYDTLEHGFGMQRQFVAVFSTAAVNNYTLSPTDLAKSAAAALASALAAPVEAEFTVIFPDSGMPLTNYGQVSLEAGIMDLPPLCGPQVMNKQYDATERANKWFASLSDSTFALPPLSITTTPVKGLRTPLVVFRNRERNIIGGFILSPYLPCVTPPSELAGDISSDYIFHATTFLEKKLGGAFLFLRAPSADLIPYIDNFSHPNAHSFGLRISATLVQYIKKASWERLRKGWFYTMPLSLPVKPAFQEPAGELYMDLQKYRIQLEQVRKTSVAIETKRAIQDLFLDAFCQYNNAHANLFPGPLAMRALRMNETLLLGLQGDYFYETGKKIAELYPDVSLLVAGNMDRSTSYIVPETRFAGGYRANRTFYAREAEAAAIHAVHSLISAVKPFNTGAEK